MSGTPETHVRKPGDIVVERYQWTNPNAVYGPRKGVQWLAQIADDNGDLVLLRVCKSRALAERACPRTALRRLE